MGEYEDIARDLGYLPKKQEPDDEYMRIAREMGYVKEPEPNVPSAADEFNLPSPTLTGATPGGQAYDVRPSAPLPEPSSATEFGRDVLRSGAAGILELPKTVGYGLETAGRAMELDPSKSWGSPMGQLAPPAEFSRPGREVKEYWGGKVAEQEAAMTPESREAPLLSPRGLAMAGARSLPASGAMMLAGGGIAGPLIRAGLSPALAGAIGYGAAEGGLSALMSASDARDIIMEAPLDQIRRSPEWEKFYNMTATNLDPDSRESMTRELMARDAEIKAAAIVGPVTALAGAPFGGAVLGPLAARVGTTGVRGLATGMGSEAIQEAIQSPAEVLASNMARQEAGEDVPLTAGMGEAAIGGGILGGAMGGVVGFVGNVAVAQQGVTQASSGLTPEEKMLVLNHKTLPGGLDSPVYDDIRAKAPELFDQVRGLSEAIQGAEVGIRDEIEGQPIEPGTMEAPIPMPPAEEAALAPPAMAPPGTQAQAPIGVTEESAMIENVDELTAGNEALLEEWEMPGLNRRERFLSVVQNFKIPVEVAQRAIEKAGGKIPDVADIYNAMKIKHSKIGEGKRHIKEKLLKPFLAKIKEKGSTLEAARNYRYAKHALERNPSIEAINPEMKDGSGWSTEDARRYLGTAKMKGLTPAMEEVDAALQKLIDHKLDLEVESGLRSKEEAAGLRKAWPNYITLKHIEAPGQVRPIKMRGHGVRGPEDIKALGRSDEAGDIIAHTVADVENTVIRAEQNRMYQKLHEIVKQFPNDAVWSIDKVVSKRVFNKSKGLVEIEEALDTGNQTIGVKIDGETHYIKIEDETLFKALAELTIDKQLRAIPIVGGALRFADSVTAQLSRLYTSLSMEFMITNFERDLQTSMVHISADESAKAAAWVMTHVPHAIKGFAMESMGFRGSEWAQRAQRMRRAGAMVEHVGWTSADVEALTLPKELEKIDPSMGERAVDIALAKPVQAIEGLNAAIENGVRLAYFTYLVEHAGMSEAQAAAATKDVTVDFNERGQLGQTMSAAYIFSPANISGNVRIIRAIKDHPKWMIPIVSSMATFSYMMANIARIFGGKDDDGEYYYDKQPEHVRYGNVLIPNFFTEQEGDFIPFKNPYGYGMFFAIGAILSDAGKKSPPDMAYDMGSAILTSFNPLGQKHAKGLWPRIAQYAPTLASPAVDLAINQKWTSRSIRPTRYPQMEDTPYSQLYYEDVNPVARFLTDAIYTGTGGTGDKSEDPWYTVDVLNPEDVEHIFEFLTGGMGKLLNNTGTTIKYINKGEKPPAHTVPFKRLFQIEPYEPRQEKGGGKLPRLPQPPRPPGTAGK